MHDAPATVDMEALAQRFTDIRPRLTTVAYAIVGSRAEAEDVVSSTWLRLMEAAERAPIEDIQAWSIVAVSRRAMNTFRSARTRREIYVGPWLPEPVLGPLRTPDFGDLADPADRVTLDDSVRYALLVVLETLTPAERTAWVLHDLFGVQFPEIAEVVGRTPQAVRQLATRARRHVQSRQPRHQVDRKTHEEVVRAFLRAAGTGDLATLVHLLDADVTLTSDGGGHVTAARRPVHGAERVSRFVLGVSGRLHLGSSASIMEVNGLPGVALVRERHTTGVLAFTIADGLIHRIDLVLAPPKLPPPPLTPESVT